MLLQKDPEGRVQGCLLTHEEPEVNTEWSFTLEFHAFGKNHFELSILWVSNGDMTALYSSADKRLLISQRCVSCHMMGGRKRLCISSNLPAKVELVTPSPASWSPCPGLEEQLTGALLSWCQGTALVRLFLCLWNPACRHGAPMGHGSGPTDRLPGSRGHVSPGLKAASSLHHLPCPTGPLLRLSSLCAAHLSAIRLPALVHSSASALTVR